MIGRRNHAARAALATVATLLAIAGAAEAGTWSISDPGQGPVPLPAGTTGANNLSGLAWISGNQWVVVADKGGAAYPL
ncbi:MAG: hypothetical protein ACKPBU_06165, partial [Alphaproteobacteria bacterium]